MATGRSNKLVGQIGEFLVCAELGRQGLIATPFAGNVPGYDVIATDERGASVPIEVKGNNGGDAWHVDGGKFLHIRYYPRSKKQRILGRKRLTHAHTVWVFVWLGHRKDRGDRFFILTHRRVQKVVRQIYADFLRRNAGRRPQTPKSTHTAIRVAHLTPYEGSWKVVRALLKRNRPRNPGA